MRFIEGYLLLLSKFGNPPTTWRIIPVSKWLVTPIYKPFSPFGRGISLLRDLRSPWVLTTYKSWDEPPSMAGAEFDGPAGRSWAFFSTNILVQLAMGWTNMMVKKDG